MSQPVIQFVAGLVLIGLLSWMTTINEDAGNVAVASILALWLLWSIRNVSKLQGLQKTIGG